MPAGRTLGVLAALLASCGSAEHPPHIAAQVCHGGCWDGAFAESELVEDLQSVLVCTDDSCSTPITDAVVTVNGITLSRWGSGRYRGYVSVPEGTPVAVAVTTGARTYELAGTQFTAAPSITGASVASICPNCEEILISWSPGAPTVDAWYEAEYRGQPVAARVSPLPIDSTTFGGFVMPPGSGDVAVAITTTVRPTGFIAGREGDLRLDLTLFSPPVPISVP